MSDIDNQPSVFLASEAATASFAAQLADQLTGGESIFIEGGLGVGKTTLARGLLQRLGVTGHVRSPTYTLVEAYETTKGDVFHLDLYRLVHPEELEFIAGRDMWGRLAIKLVEWPGRGLSWLPAPDLHLALELCGQGRLLRVISDQAALAKQAI